MSRPRPKRLADVGVPYVSRAALEQYREQIADDVGDEDARRGLTRLAADAHRVSTGDPELWRVRGPGLPDLSVRVVHDEGLAIVVSVGRLRPRARRRPPQPTKGQ